MHGDEIMAMLIMLSLFALIFGIFYIRNRENMALIERGINPRVQHRTLPRPFGSLKYGLLIVGAGVGLMAAFFLDVNMTLTKETITPSGAVHYQSHDEIYPALIAIGGGLGLIISYFIEKKWWDKVNNKTEE